MSDGDMITMPEDPNAPTPWYPVSINAQLRNSTQADWVLDGVHVRYDEAASDIEPVTILSAQQLAGLEFLRHDPPVPPHVVQDSNAARAAKLRETAAVLERQAATYEYMGTSMEQARAHAHNPGEPGETGAALAALWAFGVAIAKRLKAAALRDEASELAN